MSKSLRISRRTILKGLGTAIALPWLEAMDPMFSWAAPAPVKKAPKRLAFFYVPNGVHIPDWTPKAVGADYELPRTLQTLEPYKNDLLVLSGLTADKARPNGDGAGDHARAMAAFLTGSQPRKTHGADIRVGVSIDQVAAAKIGRATRFASLELGCEKGLLAGNCDSGYSCAYSANISWTSESTPLAKEVDPRLVFERLFSSSNSDESDASRAKRERYDRSVLDFVMEDANQLKNKMGANDQRKMDEYLTSVREIELRVARHGKEAIPGPKGQTRPQGIPKEYREHIHLLTDLLVIAFQGDTTRIATFVMANEGSNRSYKDIGVPEGHHDLSHHGGDKKKQEKISTINRFHMTQFASMLGKLKAIKEGDATLLDNCMILYGSGNSDGNRHNHDDLPILVAGKGGGSLKSGRHLQFPKDTPLTNLFLAMLDRLEVPTQKFGDSTGKLELS